MRYRKLSNTLEWVLMVVAFLTIAVVISYLFYEFVSWAEHKECEQLSEEYPDIEFRLTQEPCCTSVCQFKTDEGFWLSTEGVDFE